MKFNSLILAVFLCANAFALDQHKQAPTAPVAKVDMSHSYETLIKAVHGAMDIAATKTKKEHVEYGGVIWKWNDNFYITTPVTNHSPTSIGFETHKFPGSTDAKIVAGYHTHPLSSFIDTPSDTERFSGTDMTVAYTMHVVSFIYSEYDGTISEFIPGKTEVKMDFDEMGSFGGYYSDGTIVF